jgi:hypothetical protein
LSNKVSGPKMGKCWTVFFGWITTQDINNII